jgi:hypothetical protein
MIGFEAESSRRKLAVIRRGPATLTALVGTLALGLGLHPMTARADQVGTADYTLTSTNGLPTPSGPIPSSKGSNIAPPQVVALIEPAGGVITPPSSSTQGPLTILSGSKGFSTGGVYDYLASTTDSNGQPLQALGLSFYGQGLAAGGILNFSLNVANASSPPQLVSQTPGVKITLDPSSASSGSSSSSNSSASSTAGSEVPEPLSLLLWSALIGVGFLRAAATRRST